MHVVVIEDQPRMLELVTSYLEENGIETTGCADGEVGLATITDAYPDVVVLDLMLPGLSGTAICKALRAAGNNVPIIMLTARGEVSERVAGFQAGADDYVVKPFALEELHARIQAVARRRDEVPNRIEVGDIVVDFESHRVWVSDQEVALPRREFDVLAALLNPPGAAVSKQQIFEAIWDYADDDLRSNALEVYISRLRQHLAGSSNVVITTLRNVGYRLDVAS